MTKEEYLQDTIDYYSVDPPRRRNTKEIKQEGSLTKVVCMYSPASPHSEGCAIGRKLPLDVAKAIDEEFPEGRSVSSLIGLRRLPDELEKLGKLFLCTIQVLHDDVDYWTENGISAAGKQYVNRIIQSERLNMEKLT